MINRSENVLDLGEKIGHDAVEEFQIILQEFRNIDVSDSTKTDQFL